MRRSNSQKIALVLTLLMVFSIGMPQMVFAVKNTYAVPEELNAIFTPDSITLDGIADDAYNNAPAGIIDNAKTSAGNANYTDGNAATGELRAVWNGPVLYLLVTVHDTTVSRNSSTVNNRDGVEFSLDVWNDKIDKWEDDDGLFTVSAKGAITGSSGNQTGSVHFDSSSREFTNRIKGAAATDIIDPETQAVIGYNVEVALQIENVFDSANSLKNGRKIGVDVQINDSFVEGQARTARIFWSHNDNSYDRISTQDGNLDWGIITLTGKNPEESFVFDDWRLKELVRYYNSPKFLKGTGLYTPQTEAVFNEKLTAAQALISESSTDKAEVDTAAEELSNAILGLRRAGKYPDPYDLPSLFTLPDPWTFFDNTKGTNGKVTTVKEWKERREEILDLARYYEYGCTQNGEVSLRSVTSTNTAVTVNYRVSANGKNLDLTSKITLPTANANGPAPILLAGSGSAYTGAGIATATVPSTATDDRLNGINSRSGGYWSLFPYNRNDPTVPGVEMAAAWSFWRTIDAYELVAAQNPDVGTTGKKFNELLDIDKLACYGFSINGKISFVAGVFDERIGVVIAGAAGCTGPSPYRYNNFGPGPWNLTEYVGQHQYSWGWSDGNEVLGDTLTHQPQRINDMMWRFAAPLNVYKRVEGSFGYGDRMPFDQHLLVAAIAPRAIVVDHTKDDYGDSAEGDATGLEAAKPVYEWLGAGLDKLVFNWRDSGGHGVDAAVTARNAEYIKYYFNNTPLSESTATALFTNPYVADLVDGLNVYDRYFGGLDSMMPWRNNSPAILPEVIIQKQPIAGAILLTGYQAAPLLSVEAELRGEAGTLSYQWYSNTVDSTVGGTPIDGATLADFQVPASLAGGNYYYYAVISSDGTAPDSVSNISTISVREASHDTGISGVTVSVSNISYIGTQDSTAPMVYSVVLPYGTNLDNLAATAISVVVTDAKAKAAAAIKLDNGASWIVQVTAEDGTTTTAYTINITTPFIPITNISGVPDKINPLIIPQGSSAPESGGLLLSYTSKRSGTVYYMRGDVEPANATNRNVTWSLAEGTTNASLYTYERKYNSTYNVKMINTSAVGETFVLTATVANGLADGIDYTENFTIEVVAPENGSSATDIFGIPSTAIVGQPLTLAAKIQPENAIMQDISWTLNANGTTAPNATIEGNNRLSATGPGAVTLTATIKGDVRIMSNAQYPVKFTKDFTINFIPDPDFALVEAAVSAIEAGTYNVPVASQVDQTTKTVWIQNAVDALIPEGNGSSAAVIYNNGYEVTVTKGLIARTAAIVVTEIPGYNVFVAANPVSSGSVSGEGKYAENDAVTVTATVYSGYCFINWAENGNEISKNPTYTFTMGTTDRTLTANFKPTYTVIFKDYNGDVLKTETIIEGNPATPPDDPARDGFIFTGWDLNYYEITSDMTITAHYIKDIPPVTDKEKAARDKALLNIGFAQGDNTQAVTQNFSLTVTGAVYNSEISWHSNNSNIIKILNNEGIVTRPPFSGTNANVMVTATVYNNGASDTKDFNLTVLKLDPITCNVSVSANPAEGGTVSGAGVYNEGSSVTVTAAPKSGYSFAKWMEGNTVVSTNPSYTFALGTVGRTLTAIFTANPVTFTVTFKNYDGSVLKTETVQSGGSATAPAIPSRNGYTFAGWDIKFNSVTANLIVTAQFNINSTNDSNDNNPPTVTPKPTAIPTPLPTAAPTPVPFNIVTSSGKNTLTATATTEAPVDNNGRASAAILQEQVSSAISKALEGAERQGDGTAAVIEIKVETSEEVKTVETNLPKTAVDEVASSNTAALTVSTPIASITFDKQALNTISGEAMEDVVISISRVDAETLSEESQQLIGDHPIFNFDVAHGDKTISQFGGYISVSVPYTIKPGEDIHSIIIYYINEAGEPEIVKDCVYDPATGAVSFTTTHFSRYAIGYNRISFNDVLANAWYNNAVSFIAARNITNGTGNGNYSPESNLTRSEFLVMLMRAYDLAPDENPTDNFADAGNTYYTSYLAAAKRLGISNGVGNNMFAPDNKITRQEMATLLYNSLSIIGKLPAGREGQLMSAFVDAEQIASWAKEAMEFLTKAGVIKGSGGKLLAVDTMTRAEMAQVLYNIMSK